MDEHVCNNFAPEFGCGLLPEYGSRLVTECGCVCCQNMTMVKCLLSKSIKAFNDCHSMGAIYCYILPEYGSKRKYE